VTVACSPKTERRSRTFPCGSLITALSPSATPTQHVDHTRLTRSIASPKPTILAVAGVMTLVLREGEVRKTDSGVVGRGGGYAKATGSNAGAETGRRPLLVPPARLSGALSQGLWAPSMQRSGHSDPRGAEGAHEKARWPRRGRYGPQGPTVFYYPAQRGDDRSPPPQKNASDAESYSGSSMPGFKKGRASITPGTNTPTLTVVAVR
jgi:hypothetical protein